jgi:hypothetical protein
MSDIYWLCHFQASASNSWIHRMEGGIDVNARRNLSIVPNGDEVTVKKHTSIVDKSIATDADVYTVIASKRRLDLGTAPNLSKEHSQHRESLLAIFVWYGIQTPQVLLGLRHHALKLTVC